MNMMKRVGNARIQITVEHGSKTSKGRLQGFSVFARRSRPRRTRVGVLRVDIEDNGRAYVSEANMSRAWQGKGIGKALYEEAIQFYGELNTRFEEASTLAQRVWISLIKSGKYNFDWQEGTYICIWPKGRRRKRRR